MLGQVELGVVVEEGPSVGAALAVALRVAPLLNVRIALFEQGHCRQGVEVGNDHVRH